MLHLWLARHNSFRDCKKQLGVIKQSFGSPRNESGVVYEDGSIATID